MQTSLEAAALQQNAIRLNSEDNIAIAKLRLAADTTLKLGTNWQGQVQVQEVIPAGHKVALLKLNRGDPVIRYGQTIGTASQPVEPGEHVHTHNVQPTIYDERYAFEGGVLKDEGIQATKGTSSDAPRARTRSFQGYLRRDGRVGTRNYIAVIASVQCSAQVCHRIAGYFTPERLAQYPNVDGVIALTHVWGCAQTDYWLLQRTLAGMVNQPNLAGALLVGLGCEGNQIDSLVEVHEDLRLDVMNQPPVLEIQALGGSRKTIQAGIKVVEAMLPGANAAKRSTQPFSKLTLALECGGSDSWSGVTANPLLGRVADAVVGQGGTVVMAETPEVFGAEHLLLQRAVSPQVRQRLISKLTWWRDYVIRVGGSLEDNPSPGNQAGGLTNICEKSLGAIAKSGTTPMTAVYDYAEIIQQKGFVFMDSPGYDPVSVTGMVAGGCNLVLFTTGRGSVFGFKPAPSLKISTNSGTYQRMSEDMDFNAGRLLDEDVNLDVLADELLDLIAAAASGKKTKSEYLGLGELEFVPWNVDGMV